VLVLDTLPIYLPGLPSLLELKQERPHFHVILISRLDEKPEISIARISGVDAVLDRPLTGPNYFRWLMGLGDFIPSGIGACPHWPGRNLKRSNPTVVMLRFFAWRHRASM
jgi:hypothetical protein